MRHYLYVLIALLLTGCFARQDALEPIITIYSPPNGAVQAGGEGLQVLGYVMDDEGVASVTVNGSEMLREGAFGADKDKKLVEFGFTPTQPTEGAFAATILARDVSGREKRLNYELLIDRTPPSVEVTGASGIGGGRIRVTGVARDNHAVGTITIGGEAVQFIPSPEQEFSVDIAASEGLAIEVRDQAGNTVTQAVQ